MLLLPPPIRDIYFSDVDIADEEEIKRRFNPLIRQLHSYLNEIPCLHDLQDVRRKWKARTGEKDAFGNFVAHAGEFYTFNHGGRNEAHFNISLKPTYFAAGLCFEFTERQFGEPATVRIAYACFLQVIQKQLTEFERFVAENQLEIEWAKTEELASISFVPTCDVVKWLLKPPAEPIGIIIARVLRRGDDAALLEDPSALGNVIETVFSGFRPYWKQTQVMAKKCS